MVRKNQTESDSSQVVERYRYTQSIYQEYVKILARNSLV